MIDEWNEDRTAFARFSECRRFRYRLARALTDRARGCYAGEDSMRLRRVVFVMLNPSTADAHKADPTIRKCIAFAERWGADVLEVVNLFALRSPYPADLRYPAPGQRGDDEINDAEIDAACADAARVIVAWGTHGVIGDRGAMVRDRLRANGVKLEAIGFTDDGFPIHPLARGKMFVPVTREPVIW